MNDVFIALLIFLMRIADVSIGTIRTIYTIRGKRGLAMCLGIVESGIWILAISKAMSLMQHNPWAMVGWAFGFGAGSFVGITVEQWLAAGHILMRVISVEKAPALRDALLGEDVGVTRLPGEGRNGEVNVLFVVAPRRRSGELLEKVQAIDPNAFITIDPITTAIGGYMPIPVPATSIRK
ncbi:MAG: hypothetical protein QOF78_4587 [Phycisphaerales bacterium]|jgi:uncharacterized protein YebE (UPF0316 family)|nr:hypothetical protein [Phycisphaerales bacterium]MEA2733744.1 hypothetical protein [Humisphaera sp.]